MSKLIINDRDYKSNVPDSKSNVDFKEKIIISELAKITKIYN